jgi:hypothetical protein
MRTRETQQMQRIRMLIQKEKLDRGHAELIEFEKRNVNLIELDVITTVRLRRRRSRNDIFFYLV